MKRINGILLYALVISSLFFGACHEASHLPAAIHPNNEFKATVNGVAISVKGNNTLFSTREDTGSGEKVTVILGNWGDNSLKLTLVNIITTGTYSFALIDSVQSLLCEYTEGAPLNVTNSTQYNNGSGTVTLDSLSASYIGGTFEAKLPGASGGLVNVTSGSFKGLFDLTK
jgi:hypothetical protein